MRQQGSAFWMKHVRAIERGALSTSAYARQHGLAVKSLYYWQRKLKSPVQVPPSVETRPSTFVAVSVCEAEQTQPSNCCTLILGPGMRLEMAMLPAPEWLAALGRAAQGAR